MDVNNPCDDNDLDEEKLTQLQHHIPINLQISNISLNFFYYIREWCGKSAIDEWSGRILPNIYIKLNYKI